MGSQTRQILNSVAAMNRAKLKGMKTPSDKQFQKISKWAQQYRREHKDCTMEEIQAATAKHFNITIVGKKVDAE